MPTPEELSSGTPAQAAAPPRGEESRRRKLRQAISKAFTPQSLALALAEAPEPRQLADYVSGTNFRHQIFELIDAANREGWIGELLDTLLEARADAPDFQKAVRPIAEALARGEPLVDPGTDDGDEDGDEVPPRSQAVVWTALSLGIVGTSTATGAISGAISLSAAVPLAVGLAFLGIGVMGIAAPRSPFIRGLSRKDRQIIPGFGVVGLLLALGLSASSVITASEWLAARRTIPVVAAVQEGSAPLTGLEVFSEVAASEESKQERIWKRTSQQSGEAIFDLRPNAFYRFGVKMQRQGILQEGAFSTRLVKEPERIQLDVRNIPDGGWLRGGEQRAVVGVVKEGEPVSLNLTAAARATIQRSIEIRIASPEPQAGLRSERGPLGLPSAPWVADRRGFTLGYDPQRRRPVFTAYLLDGSRSDRLPRSSEERFVPDPALPIEAQPRNEDFRGSGYDRGHLVRLGDIRTSLEAVQEAYYLSSVVPQSGQSNRVSWMSVEQYTTTAAENARANVWILSGPVYRRSTNGKERVLVLGEGATPVPTDLFRILLRRAGPDWNVQAFLVPNDQTVERNPFEFATSVEAIEQLTGTKLLPNLPPQLKATVNRNDWRTSPADPSRPPT